MPLCSHFEQRSQSLRLWVPVQHRICPDHMLSLDTQHMVQPRPVFQQAGLLSLAPGFPASAISLLHRTVLQQDPGSFACTQGTWLDDVNSDRCYLVRYGLLDPCSDANNSPPCQSQGDNGSQLGDFWKCKLGMCWANGRIGVFKVI